MIRVNISIDEDIKKEAAQAAKARKIRGGLSGLIEELLKRYMEEYRRLEKTK